MMRVLNPRPIPKSVNDTLGSTAYSSSTMMIASMKLPPVPPSGAGTWPLTRPSSVALRRMGLVDWKRSSGVESFS